MGGLVEEMPGNRVLVVGAYGLIGSAISRHLVDEGYLVTGLGRNLKTAMTVLPQIEWVIEDLVDLADENAWVLILEGIEFVVNCAGVLQQSAEDDIANVHHHSIKALVEACEQTNTSLVQISAAGAREQASTAFMRTKALGDGCIRKAGINHWIFRPGLVLAPTAYGGSTFLRTLAAFPLLQPLACANASIQTVFIDDVTNAVSMAIQGKIPPGTECDLVEDSPHELREVIAAMRLWLGFSPSRLEIVLPDWFLSVSSTVADVLGFFGWRSPLRSSAVQMLKEGISGNPEKWKELEGSSLSTLRETLGKIPATAEDRLSARMLMLMPLVILVLFFFWFVSGIIGLLQIDAAAQTLEDVGWSHPLATSSVVFWSMVDIFIAGGLLIRKFAGISCWAMVVVSIFYLVSATFSVPSLWSDPLGPLVKILPGIVLALIARVMLGTR